MISLDSCCGRWVWAHLWPALFMPASSIPVCVCVSFVGFVCSLIVIGHGLMAASFLSLQVGAIERPQLITFPTPLPRPSGQRPRKKLVSPLLSLTSDALEHVNLHMIQHD